MKRYLGTLRTIWNMFPINGNPRGPRSKNLMSLCKLWKVYCNKYTLNNLLLSHTWGSIIPPGLPQVDKVNQSCQDCCKSNGRSGNHVGKISGVSRN